MTNADKFKGIFGIYATELWAKPEKEFSEWLNEDVPDTNVGDTISRQAAIDALRNQMSDWNDDYNVPVRKSIENIERLPSAQRKGEWTEDKACEFCGFQPWYENDIHTLSFCPNCGARMER